MLLKKNIKPGKINIFIFILFLFFFNKSIILADSDLTNELIAELSILDKVSSKNTNVKINIGKEFIFQNLVIKVLRC